MPLTLPISEQITQHVLTTLAAVNGTGGYQVALSVVRRTKAPIAAAHLQAVLHEGDDQSDPDAPLGYKGWRREYAVQVYILTNGPGGCDPDDFHSTLNVARADVEKALMVDVTRGGLAHNTEISDPQEFNDVDDCGGVIVFFSVTYRTDERDPYSPAPA